MVRDPSFLLFVLSSWYCHIYSRKTGFFYCNFTQVKTSENRWKPVKTEKQAVIFMRLLILIGYITSSLGINFETVNFKVSNLIYYDTFFWLTIAGRAFVSLLSDLIIATFTLSSTMGQNDKNSRCKYWATRSSIRSFACTAHSFTCSALLALLVRSAVLTHSLARSLCSHPSSWESEWLHGYFFWVFFHSGP